MRKLILMLLHLPILSIACDLKLTVSGTLSAGMDVHSDMSICSPDEIKRKVSVRWEGEEKENRILRTQVERLLKAVALAETEIAGAISSSKSPCHHKLTVRIERQGKERSFVGCERTPSHLLASKFHDMIRTAYFYKATR